MNSTKTQTAPALDLAALGLAPAAKPTVPCACSWTVVLPGRADLTGRPKAHRDAAEYDAETDHTFVALACEAQTQSRFAPGHDARLKGLAQTAALLGGDLAKNGQSADPLTVLQAVAPNLAEFLPTAEEVAEHAAKAAERAAKAAKATEAKAAKAEKATEVEAA